MNLEPSTVPCENTCQRQQSSCIESCQPDSDQIYSDQSQQCVQSCEAKQDACVTKCYENQFACNSRWGLSKTDST